MLAPLKHVLFTQDRTPGAAGLLVGEQTGMAIDATTYPATVAVKDTTSTNNRWNDPINGNALGATNAFLTQSGTSPKLTRHRDSLKWAPHNLSIRSEEIDNAAWTKANGSITATNGTAPDGTATAETLTASGISACSVQGTLFTTLANVVYTISGYFKAGTEDWVLLRLTDGVDDVAGMHFNLNDGSSGTASTAGTATVAASGSTSIGNGWYRCWAAIAGHTATSLQLQAYVAEADNDTAGQNGDSILLWGLQCNRGYTPTDYVATTTAAKYTVAQEYDGTEYGILCEYAATNICLRSQEFGTTWTTDAATISSDAGTAPDGSTTADKVVDTVAAGGHGITQIITISTATVYTVSVYAKAAEHTRFYINLGDADASDYFYAGFDLSGGQIAYGPTEVGTTWNSASASIEAIGSGWYRCKLTATSGTSTSARFDMYLDTGSGTEAQNNSFAGNGSDGVLFWGAQLETGSVATSYIPTAAATVTRAQDNVTGDMTTFPWSTTAGTIGFEFVPYVAAAGGAGNGAYLFFGPASANTPHFLVFSNNYSFSVWGHITLDAGDFTVGVNNISKAAFTSGDSRHWRDGTTADSAGALTIGAASTMYISIQNGGVNSRFNLIKRIVYVPRRVSNSQLPSWSFT